MPKEGRRGKLLLTDSKLAVVTEEDFQRMKVQGAFQKRATFYSGQIFCCT
jgi:hypothetical protein